jgi:hypothetical protein
VPRKKKAWNAMRPQSKVMSAFRLSRVEFATKQMIVWLSLPCKNCMNVAKHSAFKSRNIFVFIRVGCFKPHINSGKGSDPPRRISTLIARSEFGLCTEEEKAGQNINKSPLTNKKLREK